VRYDVHVLGPRQPLRLENNLARIRCRAAESHAERPPTDSGPIIFGRADVERGEIVFEGNRYQESHARHHPIFLRIRRRSSPSSTYAAEGRISRHVRSRSESAMSARPNLSRSTRSPVVGVARRQAEPVAGNSDPPLPMLEDNHLAGLRPGATGDSRQSRDAAPSTRR
jgi:hypothetical protein